VKLLLKRWTEISGHLTQSIACGIPHPWMLHKQHVVHTALRLLMQLSSTQQHTRIQLLVKQTQLDRWQQYASKKNN